jgi:hypothetical protein
VSVAITKETSCCLGGSIVQGGDLAMLTCVLVIFALGGSNISGSLLVSTVIECLHLWGCSKLFTIHGGTHLANNRKLVVEQIVLA